MNETNLTFQEERHLLAELVHLARKADQLLSELDDMPLVASKLRDIRRQKDELEARLANLNSGLH